VGDSRVAGGVLIVDPEAICAAERRVRGLLQARKSLFFDFLRREEMEVPRGPRGRRAQRGGPGGLLTCCYGHSRTGEG